MQKVENFKAIDTLKMDGSAVIHRRTYWIGAIICGTFHTDPPSVDNSMKNLAIYWNIRIFHSVIHRHNDEWELHVRWQKNIFSATILHKRGDRTWQ